MHDRHGIIADELRQRVIAGPGSLAPSLRAALASGEDIPAAWTHFATTVREDAYQVEDAHIADLIAAGYSEDQMYEATIAAALGAGVRRLDAGLRAVADAFAEPFAVLLPEAVVAVQSVTAEPAVEQPFAPIAVLDPAAAPLVRRQPGVNIPVLGSPS